MFPDAVGDWRWIGKDGFEYFGDESKLREALGKKQVGLSTLVWPDGSDQGEGVPLGTTPEFAPPKTMPLASAAPLVQHEASPFYEPEPVAPTELEHAPPAEPAYGPPPAPQPYFQGSEPPAAAYRSPPARPASTSMGALLLGIGVFAFVCAIAGGLVVGLGVFKSGEAKKPAASTAPSPASAPSSEKPKPAGFTKCSAEAPKRLSEAALGRVALDAVDVGDHVGLAFAENEHAARALSLDPVSLGADLRDPVKSKGAIAGVAASASGSNVELSIDVSEAELKSSKTIFGPPPFRIGSTKEGIATRRGDQTSMVWPGGSESITVPRVETVPGVGHFVSFRRGTKELAAGWLELDGKKKTELASVRFEARALGTPSLASDSNGVLLMVAARTPANANWLIAAGHAKNGSVPVELTPLSLGDTSTPSISPSAAPLPNNQWIVQWTTGPSDAHVVHVALFDESLKRTSEPVAVSAAGSDAGQGVIWSNGKQTVSFYLVAAEKTHELWAARVKCE